MAEALGMLRGCQLAVHLGLCKVIFESDSQDTISSLSHLLDSGSWEAFPTLTLVKRFEKSFQVYHWSWVPKSANLAADFLASHHNTEMCNQIWVSCPPSSLVHVLDKDGLPCSPGSC